MEILRFEENESFAPRRKKSSRTWVALAFFGVVLGVGSAFASSTIAINGTNTVALGQGVAATVNCQPSGQSLTVTPGTNLWVDPTSSDSSKLSYFYLSSIDISNVDSNCVGQDFKVQIFKPKDSAGAPTQNPCQSNLIGIKAGTSASNANYLPDHTACDSNGAYYFRVKSSDTFYRLVFIDPGSSPSYFINSQDFGYVTIESTNYSY